MFGDSFGNQKGRGPSLQKKNAIGGGRGKGVKKMLDTDSELDERQDLDDFDMSDGRDQSQFSEQDSEVSKFSMG